MYHCQPCWVPFNTENVPPTQILWRRSSLILLIFLLLSSRRWPICWFLLVSGVVFHMMFLCFSAGEETSVFKCSVSRDTECSRVGKQSFIITLGCNSVLLQFSSPAGTHNPQDKIMRTPLCIHYSTWKTCYAWCFWNATGFSELHAAHKHFLQSPSPALAA